MEFVIIEEPSKDAKVFYRYTDSPALYDSRTVTLHKYYVTKETKCGWWITDRWGDEKRWVGNSGKKRFAYPTEEQAMIGFLKRKSRQILILENQLTGARKALEIGKKIQSERVDGTRIEAKNS